MKKLVLTTVALAMVCTTAWCQGGRQVGGAQGRAGGAAMRGGMGMSCPAMALQAPPAAALDRFAEQAQLTDDQVAKLKTVMTTADEAMKPLQKTAGDATKALRDALVAETFDAAQVKTLAAAAQKAEDAIITASIREWAQIRAIVSAEQAKAFGQMNRGGMGGPGGPGGAGGPGGPGGRQQGPPPAQE